MAARRPLPSLPPLGSGLAPPPEFHASVVASAVALDAQVVRKLSQYLELLLAANQRMNLTAVTQANEAWMRLVLDAVMFLPLIDEVPSGGQLVDVGTGAGLPGLVLAIARPRLRCTLVDATAKKLAFLEQVRERLELDNVRLQVGRAEALAAPGGPLREAFDIVTARAVARLPTLLELTSPFARAPAAGRPGGLLLLAKGGQAGQELKEARRALEALQLEHEAERRTPTGTLLTFRKRAATPVRYPRANGVPKHHPL